MPSSRHALRALLAASVVAALGATVAAPTQAAQGAAVSALTTVTTYPTVITKAQSDMINPLRGQYLWLGIATSPAGWPATDTYYRDQVAWSRVEPSPGVYDWSWFDAGMAEARKRHGYFGFRIMAYCPGCWLNATPSWLPKQAGTVVPDWNSTGFLTAWERLMAAIAKRYAANPSLGFVDVGGYGAYGEWHNYADKVEISLTNASRVIQAVLKSFPNQHVVINAVTPKYVDLALSLSPRMGLRMDCLGEKDMFSALPSHPAWQSRWRTAILIGEWCHTATTDTVRGASQVRQYHISMVGSANLLTPYTSMTLAQKQGFIDAVKSSGYRYQATSMTLPSSVRSGTPFTMTLRYTNAGAAPTYDRWLFRYAFRNAAGTYVAVRAVGTDLRSLVGGTLAVSQTVTLTLPPGTYTVVIHAADPTGLRTPMRFANTGRDARGGYPVGKIVIT